MSELKTPFEIDSLFRDEGTHIAAVCDASGKWVFTVACMNYEALVKQLGRTVERINSYENKSNQEGIEPKDVCIILKDLTANTIFDVTGSLALASAGVDVERMEYASTENIRISDAQTQAYHRAIKMWVKETGNEMAWLDDVDLWFWLMGRFEQAQQQNHELAARISRLQKSNKQMFDALVQVLGWRELNGNHNPPIDRIEEIARGAIGSAKQIMGEA
jgi:succinate dehydrogenase flavin-adding protein (antitoxin of CptAB toxin-antitoxin module)